MRNDFESNYLQHWGLKKGSEKDNHKYFARLGETGKYIYFYTREAYEKYIKGTKEEAQKKVSDATRKMQDAITKGYKLLERKLNKEKDKQIKNDLSTENVRNEKRNVQKEKANEKRRKDLSTISAKEKASEKAAGRKVEAEAKRKAHINELKEKGIEKKRQEKRQLEAIKKKQQERVNKADEKRAIEEGEKRKKQKENWLSEFRKKAKDLFAKDAKDSAKEDHTKHPEIPIKKSVLSKRQDMAAVNRGKRFYEIKMENERKVGNTYGNQQYYDWMKKADSASNNCANCTIAYDLRRRGYDVSAPIQVNNRGMNIQEMLLCYKTPKGKDPKTYTTSKGETAIFDVEHTYKVTFESSGLVSSNGFSETKIQRIKKDILKKYPEGSYGILGTTWVEGGGHAQTWSIENGDVLIRDSQINEVDRLENRLAMSKSCVYVRTDNLELTDKAYEYAIANEVDGATVVKKRK